MNIKNFFSTLWSKVLLVLGVVVAILFYILNLKKKEANALKARISLLTTEKEADIIETEIKGLLEDRQKTTEEIAELKAALKELAQKRQALKKAASNKTPKEIEDFWENN